MEINVNINRFAEQFKKEYAALYDAAGRNAEIAGAREAVAEFDRLLCENASFQKFVGEFAKFRLDFISSDREAAAFMFALDALAA